MSDIYTIDNWVASTTYTVDDIVFINNLYYYCKTAHTSSSSFNTDNNSGYWRGIININGVNYPYFEWISSYNYSFDIKPKVKNIQFGDNYIQSVKDGINNVLLPLNLEFNNRGLQEYSAILHFLDVQAGVTQFYFIPPSPFNVLKRFVCQQWQSKQSFYENYSVTALLEERV